MLDFIDGLQSAPQSAFVLFGSVWASCRAIVDGVFVWVCVLQYAVENEELTQHLGAAKDAQRQLTAEVMSALWPPRISCMFKPQKVLEGVETALVGYILHKITWLFVTLYSYRSWRISMQSVWRCCMKPKRS